MINYSKAWTKSISQIIPVCLIEWSAAYERNHKGLYRANWLNRKCTLEHVKKKKYCYIFIW